MLISDQARRMGETILIVCIVTILTGAWARGTAHSKLQAYHTQTKSQITAIANALRLYELDQGAYPPVVEDKPFCFPFNKYQSSICLGELVGPYLQADTVPFDQTTYVYRKEHKGVSISANIPVSDETPLANRCDIYGERFWCIKLR